MKHPNSEILIALAEGRPIQAQFEASPWTGMDTFDRTIWLRLVLADNPRYKFRVKPETITVNGFEVPAPCREPLKEGTRYFVANPLAKGWIESYKWNNDRLDNLWLKRGLVHLTADVAITYAKAWMGEENDL